MKYSYEMTFIDYIQLFNDAVRYYNAAGRAKWEIPQTFALLNIITDLQAPNLGKYICDKNKPFFYSKKWEYYKHNPSKLGFDMPVVLMFENAGDYKKPFQRQSETTHTFDLFVMDRHSAEDCRKTNCPEGLSRSIYEIYHDTEQIMYNVLSYFGNLVVINHPTKGTTLKNREHFAYLQANNIGDWNTWVIDEPATLRALKDLRDNNMNRAFHRVEPFINADWFGTKITVRFTVPNCRDFEPDFESAPHFGSIWDKNCC